MSQPSLKLGAIGCGEALRVESTGDGTPGKGYMYEG